MKSYKKSTKTLLRNSKIAALTLLSAIPLLGQTGASASPARPFMSPQSATVVADGRVAFESTRSGRSELYVMNADGSNQTRVTLHDDIRRETAAIEPSISRDGNKIVHIELGVTPGKSEIFSINSDGTNLTRLTNNLFDEWRPCWSSDGTKVAFSSKRDGDSSFEIYVMNTDGTNLTRITNNAYFDGYASWSPDDSQLAFSSNRNDKSSIFIVNADGTNEKPLLSNFTDSHGNPVWSPDGSKIAFGSERSRIYTVNVDGSNLNQITANFSASYQIIEGSPSWSPDGNQIGFQSYRGGDFEYSFYKINADGTNLTRVTGAGSNVWTPTWGRGRVQSAAKDPIAYDQRKDVYEEVPNSLTLTGFDPLGSPLTYSLITYPTHGTLSGTAPNLIYTSDVDYNGPDSFTFKVNNGTEDSATATFSMYVQVVDDAPTITSVGNQVINEDSSTNVLSFTIDDDYFSPWLPADFSVHTISASSDNPNLFPQNGITLGGSGANRTIKLTPALNQNGTANITVRVEEPSKLFSTITFKVTVQPVNDAPTISTIANPTINEDSSSTAFNFTIDDLETPVANLIVTAISSNQELFNSNSIAISGQGAQRVVTLLPRPDANGLATITLKVTDTAGAFSEIQFVVAVNPVNDAPIALNQTLTVAVKQPLNITLPVTNVDGDELTYEIVSSNYAGSLTGQGQTRVFTPTDPGTASFTFRVRDTQGTISNVGTITVNVTAPQGFKVSGNVSNYKQSATGLTIESIPNAVIRLEQKGQVRYTLTPIGSNGYSVFGVASGDYIARVYTTGGQALAFDPLSQSVKIKKANFVLKPFALYSVFGQVTATLPKVGKSKVATVVPVAGATVNATMAISGYAPIIVATTTDANGFYYFTGFPKGKVTLLVNRAGVTMPSKGKYSVSLPSSSKTNKPNARYDIKGTATSSFVSSINKP